MIIRRNSATVAAGIALLAMLVIFSISKAIVSTGITLDPAAIEDSPIRQYLKRYEQVRKSLPPRGTIGYVTDVSPSEIDSNLDASAHYIMTQYALTPLIVAKTPCYEFVVGNFDAPSNVYYFSSENMVLVEDFRNGLALYRNTGGC